MVLETLTGGIAFLLARLLFGGVLAFMGLNHFRQRDAMTGYAAHKGLPAPGVAVVGSGVILVAGGVGLILGVFPVLSAAAIAVFLLTSAVVMHDFWNAGDPEEQQTEMTQFLKNAALSGGALALLAVGSVDWPYALAIGL